jgi:hypothetical protein
LNLPGKRAISSLPRCLICSVFTFPSFIPPIVNVYFSPTFKSVGATPNR